MFNFFHFIQCLEYQISSLLRPHGLPARVKTDRHWKNHGVPSRELVRNICKTKKTWKKPHWSWGSVSTWQPGVEQMSDIILLLNIHKWVFYNVTVVWPYSYVSCAETLFAYILIAITRNLSGNRSQTPISSYKMYNPRVGVRFQRTPYVCILKFRWRASLAVSDMLTNPTLRWGWVFLERTRILSETQFTTQFIDCLVVETKRFVGSFVHVILTRQTCGQRSSKAAECKHRALGNYFSEWICYMFLLSKCRGDSDLGLWTTSGLAFGEPQRNYKIRFFLRRNTFFVRKSPLRLGSPNASPEVVHRPRSESPLNFDNRNI